jgi:RNA polymerase subunit RPABC4/transcription elongation factor Spt4
MECRNCGFDLKPDEKVCPICQMGIDGKTNDGYIKSDIVINGEQETRNDSNFSSANIPNSAFDHYKETENLNKELGFSTMLILSAVETFCCNQLFGIIAIVLLLIKFKPAVEARDLEAAKSTKKIVNTILIIGLLLGILLNIGYIVLTVLSEL